MTAKKDKPVEPVEEPTVVVHDYDPVRPKGEKKPKASDDEGGE